MKFVKDPTIYLEEILDCVESIESYMKEVSKTSFFEDAKTQDAVIRRIEIIGEIVKRLPSLLKAKAPSVPWKDIAGMRDILVHDYASIDLKETWQVATVDVPKLGRNIKKILKITKKEK